LFNPPTPWMHTKSPVRRHDWGFTFGGPVDFTKKIYDGHNKTFFFFNFEQYRDLQHIATIANTVPIQDYRDGNFSRALTGKNLCPAATPNCDPLGRPVFEGTIYDPATTRVVNGFIVRNPFTDNIIPKDRMDPVALKIQSL